MLKKMSIKKLRKILLSINQEMYYVQEPYVLVESVVDCYIALERKDFNMFRLHMANLMQYIRW
jgi:hypothetical protein